ncbi:phosphoribosylanthranilate isomerase, partial [Chloroflexi bacterium]|nr:phosphoribosylanthranilate isomerase [Chloroflexota bacterium]
DYVQLCGNEDLKYIQELDIKVIKVIHIKSQDSVKEVKKKINDYLLICEYIILDTYSKKASGGTGKSFDWNEYSSLFSKKVFVAGGLNPDNVSEVVKTYAPWGIDVSSGVETNGEKDIYKIENFINRSN